MSYAQGMAVYLDGVCPHSVTPSGTGKTGSCPDGSSSTSGTFGKCSGSARVQGSAAAESRSPQPAPHPGEVKQLERGQGYPQDDQGDYDEPDVSALHDEEVRQSQGYRRQAHDHPHNPEGEHVSPGSPRSSSHPSSGSAGSPGSPSL